MPSYRCVYRGRLIALILLRVVCFNHWERLDDMLPLSGDVRALDLLPRIARSRESAMHSSSQRRGVCEGLAGTTRVCPWLGACLCVFCCSLFRFECFPRVSWSWSSRRSRLQRSALGSRVVPVVWFLRCYLYMPGMLSISGVTVWPSTMLVVTLRISMPR